MFKRIQIKAINVSLDSLNEVRFNSISKRKYVKRIINNINLLLKNEFTVKVTVVLMKGINEDEIIDFINWTKDKKISISVT